jgi:hypothetical protein
MPFLIAIITAAGALYFWTMRARNAADAAHTVIDMAKDVRLAARRFGFTQKTNIHPVESTDDPQVLATALSTIFFELEGYPSADTQRALMVRIQNRFNMNIDAAEELLIFSKWLADQCQSPLAGITRISRRLYKLAGSDAIDDVMDLISGTLENTGQEPSQHQIEALQDISRGLHV